MQLGHATRSRLRIHLSSILTKNATHKKIVWSVMVRYDILNVKKIVFSFSKWSKYSLRTYNMLRSRLQPSKTGKTLGYVTIVTSFDFTCLQQVKRKRPPQVQQKLMWNWLQYYVFTDITSCTLIIIHTD